MEDSSKNILVSIIVPVYNVGNCIHRCIQSIINQTYPNLEIILVNDGSTDNSGKIIDEYSLKDSRIKTLHKKNGGVTSARKSGWKLSHGEYCMFVDSDDFLQDDCIEFFLNCFNKTDCEIVTGWYDMVYDNEIVAVECKHILGLFNIEDYVQNSVKCINGFQSIWIGMFKSKLFCENIFEIDRSFFRGEDSTTFIGVLNNANHILVTSKIFYHYYQRDNSVTHVQPIELLYVLKLHELQYEIIKYKKYYAPILINTLLACYYKETDKDRKFGYKKKLKKVCLDNLPLEISLTAKIKIFFMKNPILEYLFRKFMDLIK